MYGMCALGTSIDRAAQDRGMLGLRKLANSQGTIETNITDWSQWRYVVKLWFSGSGTSGTTLALDPPFEVSARTHQGPPSKECRAWFPCEKRWHIASVVFGSMQRVNEQLREEIWNFHACSETRKAPGSTCLCWRFERVRRYTL